jgi:hypothetical protein
VTNQFENLKFPSGRPVKSARQDAKKLSREKNIPYSQALDIVCQSNGVDLPWAKAISQLTEQATVKEIEIFSHESLTLANILKEAKAARKVSGQPLADTLIKVCREYEISNPEQASKAMYLPVTKNEIHRIMAENRILTFRALEKHLILAGYEAPEKPCTSTRYTRHCGWVQYGFATKIEKADGKRNALGDTTKEGWWVCKYGLNEPRIDLTSLGDSQIKFIADFFGLRDFISGYDMAHRKRWDEKPIFESIKKWAQKYPKLAKEGLDSYSGNWGEMALGIANEDHEDDDFIPEF